MFAPFSEADFQVVAMHKAEGREWAFIASQTRLPREQIERWPWTHPEAWDQALTTAESVVARDTMTEMLLMLRCDLIKATGKERATIVNSITRLLKLQLHQKNVLEPVAVPHAEPDDAEEIATPTPAKTPSSEILPPLPTLDPLPLPAPTTPMTAAKLKALFNTLAMFIVLCGMAIGVVGCALARLQTPVAVLVAKADVGPEECVVNEVVVVREKPLPPRGHDAQGEACPPVAARGDPRQ